MKLCQIIKGVTMSSMLSEVLPFFFQDPDNASNKMGASEINS